MATARSAASSTQAAIRELFAASARAKEVFLKENGDALEQAIELVAGALAGGRKVLLFGNGGSAADAQHIAAELVGRYQRERRALPAIALTTDTSILTALANDYSYADVFARQVEALGGEGDVLIGISTSGNSANVLAAVRAAKARGLATIGLAGESGGQLREAADVCFCVPSRSTSRIQETHITVGHALCEMIESELFGNES